MSCSKWAYEPEMCDGIIVQAIVIYVTCRTSTMTRLKKNMRPKWKKKGGDTNNVYTRVYCWSSSDYDIRLSCGR